MDLQRNDILLFDGDCGLCTRIVQLVLRLERKETLWFASLQSPFARRVLQQHRELQGIDSVAWVEAADPSGRTVLVRSDAILRLARYLGFPWSLIGAARLIPRRFSDRLYDWIARRRHRWFGPASVCSFPTPEERKRMVEA